MVEILCAASANRPWDLWKGRSGVPVTWTQWPPALPPYVRGEAIVADTRNECDACTSAIIEADETLILPGRHLCDRCQLRLLDEILSDLESPAE